ncbi:hypothetical protein BDA96_02G126700 [Sorghum bicolor]|uniref:Uncharacterized protein n=2 Tax=Sorghum bicolor TaxID=4558 RepID=A0A921USE8_SORBI|nr:hypothetical protein BDA96_02G126700 [Sorghum bicolor]OQU88914.1 hypothetical protein SORBI_3002G120850 [Sorghum bicolor]
MVPTKRDRSFTSKNFWISLDVRLLEAKLESCCDALNQRLVPRPIWPFVLSRKCSSSFLS